MEVDYPIAQSDIPRHNFCFTLKYIGLGTQYIGVEDNWFPDLVKYQTDNTCM